MSMSRSGKIYNAGGGRGTSGLIATELKKAQHDMYARTILMGPIPMRNREQESRQLSVVETHKIITVNVARQDFPAIKCDIIVKFLPSCAQASWQTFLNDISVKLDVQFIHTLIDRDDNSPVHRTLRLRDKGQYLVRQREESAVLETLYTGVTPTQISWPITGEINTALDDLRFQMDLRSDMQKRVDLLITQPQTRKQERDAETAILGAETPEDILEVIHEVMTVNKAMIEEKKNKKRALKAAKKAKQAEMSTNPLLRPDQTAPIAAIATAASALAETTATECSVDSLKESSTDEDVLYDKEVDIVSLHRIALESFNRWITVKKEPELIAKLPFIEFIDRTIEKFRDEVDILVTGLRLLNDLTPHLQDFKTQVLDIICDCIQAYAPDPPSHRPRLPIRYEVKAEDDAKAAREAAQIAKALADKERRKAEEMARKERMKYKAPGSGGNLTGQSPVNTPNTPNPTLTVSGRQRREAAIGQTKMFEVSKSRKKREDSDDEEDSVISKGSRSTMDGSRFSEHDHSHTTNSTTRRRRVIEEESSTEANLLDNDENRLKPVWEGTKGNADAKRKVVPVKFRPNDSSMSLGSPGEQPSVTTMEGDGTGVAYAFGGNGTGGRLPNTPFGTLTEAAPPAPPTKPKRPKPLPVTQGVKFRGITGKLKKEMTFSQCLATLFKVISNHYTFRCEAFRMELPQEISDIALTCQGYPHVLEYIIWILNAMYADGYYEEDVEVENYSSFLGQNVVGSEADVMGVSNDQNEGEPSEAPRNPDYPSVVHATSTITNVTDYHDLDQGRDTRKRKGVKPEKPPPSMELLLNVKPVEKQVEGEDGKITGAHGRRLSTASHLDTNDDDSFCTNPMLKNDAIEEEEEGSGPDGELSEMQRKRAEYRIVQRQRLAEMQKKVDESSDKCTFDSRAGRRGASKIDHVGARNSVMAGSGNINKGSTFLQPLTRRVQNDKVKASVGDELFQQRYDSKPRDEVIICCSMISNHCDVAGREQKLATGWLNHWEHYHYDEDNLQAEILKYTTLRRKGVDLAGL